MGTIEGIGFEGGRLSRSSNGEQVGRAMEDKCGAGK